MAILPIAAGEASRLPVRSRTLWNTASRAETVASELPNEPKPIELNQGQSRSIKVNQGQSSLFKVN
jgi:hypothetical protein